MLNHCPASDAQLFIIDKQLWIHNRSDKQAQQISMHLYIRQSTVRYESTDEKMQMIFILMIQIPKDLHIMVTLFPMQILLIGASP